jgi:hypothetical protein
LAGSLAGTLAAGVPAAGRLRRPRVVVLAAAVAAPTAVAAATPPERLVLVTLAVALRRLGPTSSTSISKTVRFSPSRVSKDRCFSRPCTITRMPRCSDSATFSAACRQTEQDRNSVSPSFHSLACRSKVRGVDAIRKLATAAPEGVKRSSGSSTRLPMIVMTVSPAIRPPAVGGPVGLGSARQCTSGRMTLVRSTDSFRVS